MTILHSMLEKQSPHQKSSVASTQLETNDDQVMLAPHYPVDDIIDNQHCELHVKVVNITMKAAVGFVLRPGSTTTYHCHPVPDGYVVAGVDEVMPGFEPVKPDIPADEDGDLTKPGEAIGSTVLWPKEYIVLPNSKPMPPPALSPPPPPHPPSLREQTPRQETPPTLPPK
jgi:hypothetical protein